MVTRHGKNRLVPGQRSIMAVQTTPHQDLQNSASQVVNGNNVEPAPTINFHIISSLNGNAEIPALPDSGANIPVAGKVPLGFLGEHEDNLLPSQIIPGAVNGTKMYPIRMLPVKVAL